LRTSRRLRRERCCMKKSWWILFLVLLVAIAGSQAGNHNTYPLPEDRGTAGTLAALEKLPVYVRVLQTTAHPDDESAGTLTWLSRKFHAQTALFCLTRGEGGQNILGSEKYEELGLVRTGELLEACRYYGTDLFFGSVLDFGFSKSAEETLSKWNHDSTLAEMVRFIRQWRPTILISRFQGSSADGHGHHQAAGILTCEAFRAAADPNFPNQIRSGLPPWRITKLYLSSPMGPMSGNFGGNAAAWTVRVPVGDYDPVLGRSYREIAMEGYSKHRSQGDGAAYAMPGSSYEYFKLEESSVGLKPKENTFFEGIDTSLTAIANLASAKSDSVPFLRETLSEVDQAASEALHSFQVSQPEKSAAAVSKGIQTLATLVGRVKSSSITWPERILLLDALETKQKDFQEALNAVLGIYLVVQTPEYTGVPGEKLPVTTTFYNRGSGIVYQGSISIRASGKVTPEKAKVSVQLSPGDVGTYQYSIEFAPDARVTEPFWYLEKPGDTRYKMRSTENEFAPFGKSEISAEAIFQGKGQQVAPITAIAEAQAGSPLRGTDFVDFQIVPELSVTLDPTFCISPLSSSSERCSFQATVLNNRKGETHGTLKLHSGAGWKFQPEATEFKLSRKGETYTATFSVQIPAGTKAGNYSLEASATTDGREFRRGYHVISYPENWTRNFYFPAQSRIERFNISIAPKLTVGYIPGSGDDVPGALEQLGVRVQMLSGSDLQSGDLSRFKAIVAGIRAYNVNEDLRANNKRLLDYVSQGGTLIVQYVRPERFAPGSIGSSFPFGPYPMSVSDSDRITVEDSPVKILDPANPVFSRPNKITEADFQGWVQERGLYFSSSWDSHYQPLLSGNDPGDQPQNGGMLYTKYGKGHFIYTGYSWFRQLPAGVPGAFRIFANMLSLGGNENAEKNQKPPRKNAHGEH
jgi:LmbE family N-acetylglucosaminyl deacetylase